MPAGDNLRGLWRGLRLAFSDPNVQAILLLTLVLIGVASIFYRVVEGWSILDSVYFSVITIATVGYGDLAPQTALGKIFTIGYIFCGIGLFVAAVSSIGEGILRAQKHPKDKI